MAVYETFSKRMRRLEGSDNFDVYQYVAFPQPFRVQVIHIWRDSIGWYANHRSQKSNDVWDLIHDIIARELGVVALGSSIPYRDLTTDNDKAARCRDYLLGANTQGILDIIEWSFRVIDKGIREREGEYKKYGVAQTPDDAIDELNHRFKEHRIGYQYEDGNIIRVDSQYIHAESVKPALQLISGKEFAGAAEEFHKAHEHYREGDNKAAIVEALKAFESVMKVICAARQWTTPLNPNASKLIETIFANNLVPTEIMSQFTALRSVLESGLPTVRNRTSGHGSGETPIVVPDYLAAYALHLAAPNIVLIVEAHKALPK